MAIAQYSSQKKLSRLQAGEFCVRPWGCPFGRGTLLSDRKAAHGDGVCSCFVPQVCEMM